MDAQKLAGILDGMEYPLEISAELRAQAKAAGLVIVYGASDDLMELDGAVRDEFGCYEGGTALVDAKGFLPAWDDLTYSSEEECKAYFARKESARAIKAIWGEGDVSWTYATDLPHSEFQIMEDDEVYGIGIVISLADLVATPAPSPKVTAADTLAASVEDFLAARIANITAWHRAKVDSGDPWAGDSAVLAEKAEEQLVEAVSRVAAACGAYRHEQ